MTQYTYIYIFLYFAIYVDYILTSCTYLPVVADMVANVVVCVCSRRLVIPAAPRQHTLVVASRNEVEFGARGKS